MSPRPSDNELEASPRRKAFRARWIFPAEGPPLEHATLEIEGDRIAAIHRRHDPSAFDLGNVALIPGLVNAHTHLELSDVSSPLTPAAPFTAWLQAVMGHRKSRAGDAESAVSAGLEESCRTGTTLAGDIVAPQLAMAKSPTVVRAPQRIAFLELLGLSRERIAAQLDLARSYLNSTTKAGRFQIQPGAYGKGDIPGLSPHAPYSVHPDLFQGAVDLAARFRAPLAMHVAETRAELELLSTGTGEFVAFLERLGVWQAGAIPRETRPLDYLKALARVGRALVVHGNYLAGDEIEFLAQHENLAVVYCPRTHAYFGHSPHPWREMLSQGVTVLVGTDSRASSPDLSLWKELQFLRAAAPDVDPAVILRMGTLDAARALTLGDETGSLTVGKRADLAIVALPAIEATDPYRLLFHAESRVSSVEHR